MFVDNDPPSLPSPPTFSEAYQFTLQEDLLQKDQKLKNLSVDVFNSPNPIMRADSAVQFVHRVNYIRSKRYPTPVQPSWILKVNRCLLIVNETTYLDVEYKSHDGYFKQISFFSKDKSPSTIKVFEDNQSLNLSDNNGKVGVTPSKLGFCTLFIPKQDGTTPDSNIIQLTCVAPLKASDLKIDKTIKEAIVNQKYSLNVTPPDLYFSSSPRFQCMAYYHDNGDPLMVSVNAERLFYVCTIEPDRSGLVQIVFTTSYDSRVLPLQVSLPTLSPSDIQLQLLQTLEATTPATLEVLIPSSYVGKYTIKEANVYYQDQRLNETIPLSRAKQRQHDDEGYLLRFTPKTRGKIFLEVKINEIIKKFELDVGHRPLTESDINITLPKDLYYNTQIDCYVTIPTTHLYTHSTLVPFEATLKCENDIKVIDNWSINTSKQFVMPVKLNFLGQATLNVSFKSFKVTKSVVLNTILAPLSIQQITVNSPTTSSLYKETSFEVIIPQDYFIESSLPFQHSWSFNGKSESLNIVSQAPNHYSLSFTPYTSGPGMLTISSNNQTKKFYLNVQPLQSDDITCELPDKIYVGRNNIIHLISTLLTTNFYLQLKYESGELITFEKEVQRYNKIKISFEPRSVGTAVLSVDIGSTNVKRIYLKIEQVPLEISQINVTLPPTAVQLISVTFTVTLPYEYYNPSQPPFQFHWKYMNGDFQQQLDCVPQSQGCYQLSFFPRVIGIGNLIIQTNNQQRSFPLIIQPPPLDINQINVALQQDTVLLLNKLLTFVVTLPAEYYHSEPPFRYSWKYSNGEIALLNCSPQGTTTATAATYGCYHLSLVPSFTGTGNLTIQTNNQQKMFRFNIQPPALTKDDLIIKPPPLPLITTTNNTFTLTVPQPYFLMVSVSAFLTNTTSQQKYSVEVQRGEVESYKLSFIAPTKGRYILTVSVDEITKEIPIEVILKPLSSSQVKVLTPGNAFMNQQVQFTVLVPPEYLEPDSTLSTLSPSFRCCWVYASHNQVTPSCTLEGEGYLITFVATESGLGYLELFFDSSQTSEKFYLSIEQQLTCRIEIHSSSDYPTQFKNQLVEQCSQLGLQVSVVDGVAGSITTSDLILVCRKVANQPTFVNLSDFIKRENLTNFSSSGSCLVVLFLPETRRKAQSTVHNPWWHCAPPADFPSGLFLNSPVPQRAVFWFSFQGETFSQAFEKENFDELDGLALFIKKMKM